MCPGKYSSNSTGSPSITFNSRTSVVSTEHVREFCEDKAQNQGKRAPLLSTADWSVMQQSRSHPWNCIPFDRRYSEYLIRLIQDQFFRNINQCFELFEVHILGCTQIVLVILSKMYRCFHICLHNDSPDHRVDVDVRQSSPC